MFENLLSGVWPCISTCRLFILSHAGSVALVMNPKTALVSPQFHLVFDDNFETVPHLRAGTVSENWADLVTNSREKSTEGFYDISKTWFYG